MSNDYEYPDTTLAGTIMKMYGVDRYDLDLTGNLNGFVSGH